MPAVEKIPVPNTVAVFADFVPLAVSRKTQNETMLSNMEPYANKPTITPHVPYSSIFKVLVTITMKINPVPREINPVRSAISPE